MTKNIWIPFYYTAKIKRDPGFFLKQVVLEELPIVLLAFGLFGTGLHIASWIAIGFLFMALISVYEIGYADNDRIGERKEAHPKLTPNYRALGEFRIAPFAWGWAIVFSVIGITVLPSEAHTAALARLGFSTDAASLSGHAILVGVWLGVILVSQIAFLIFNQAALKWRVFAYVPLHVSKYFGFALIFASSLIGMVFLAAHIVRTWSLYAVRRAGGDMEFIASQMVRLVFFILFLGVLVADRGATEILGAWQTWIILGFAVFRAIPELARKMR